MAFGMHFNFRIVSAAVAVAAVAVTPVALARAAPVAATPADAPSPAARAQLTLVVGTVLSPPHVVFMLMTAAIFLFAIFLATRH